MDRAQKITIAVSAMVVAGLMVLAAPPVMDAAGWAAARLASVGAEPAASPSPSEGGTLDGTEPGTAAEELVSVGNGTSIPAGGPGDCDEAAWIHMGEMNAWLYGELADQGVREFAAGEAGLDEEGRVVTYTVAPGDALYAISDRFCIANPHAIDTLNHTRMIQPGDVLLLRPNKALPWIPYFSPPHAPAGYQQIPYQNAVEAMSAAAQAGDIAAMRRIFEDDLAALFPNPDHANVVARALELDRLDVLRHMFA
ncbi:LysM domain-containing protein [Microbacterium sp. NPDC077184]|uniref:LysM domain-containing protein n=1 Tax=Microbacterium sp. NPDC077184 TaxID=3154764 RepID=UPI003415BD21